MFATYQIVTVVTMYMLNNQIHVTNFMALIHTIMHGYMHGCITLTNSNIMQLICKSINFQNFTIHITFKHITHGCYDRRKILRDYNILSLC